ncbi:MAG: hypothetical protein JRH15_22015 [Deltaproteobacteria bacterium]|nr:hypothetical protein [Deltaproteobacteria bacterium]
MGLSSDFFDFYHNLLRSYGFFSLAIDYIEYSLSRPLSHTRTIVDAEIDVVGEERAVSESASWSRTRNVPILTA